MIPPLCVLIFINSLFILILYIGIIDVNEKLSKTVGIFGKIGWKGKSGSSKYW